jgi:hypothetical protein
MEFYICENKDGTLQVVDNLENIRKVKYIYILIDHNKEVTDQIESSNDYLKTNKKLIKDGVKFIFIKFVKHSKDNSVDTLILYNYNMEEKKYNRMFSSMFKNGKVYYLNMITKALLSNEELEMEALMLHYLLKCTA